MATRYSIRLNCLSKRCEPNRTSLTERSKAPNCFSFAFNTNLSPASCSCSKASDKKVPRVPKLSRNACRSGADVLTRISREVGFGLCIGHASARLGSARQYPETQHPPRLAMPRKMAFRQQCGSSLWFVWEADYSSECISFKAFLHFHQFLRERNEPTNPAETQLAPPTILPVCMGSTCESPSLNNTHPIITSAATSNGLRTSRIGVVSTP